MNDKLSEQSLDLFDEIKDGIKELAALVSSSSFYHASVAKLPIAEVQKDGHDTVFDDIEYWELQRYEEHEAINQYLDAIELHSKSFDYSNKAGRRTVGIIHLAVTQERGQEILNKVLEINAAKKALEKNIVDAIPDYYERAKFYQQHFSGYLMLSVFRQIPIAVEPLQRVSFSWVKNGYSEDKIEYETALSLVRTRVDAKVRKNPRLKMDDLLRMDTERLKCANKNKLYWIRPTKLNPNMELVYLSGERTSIRASIPLLMIEPSPRRRYPELNDYRGVVRKTVGAKTAQRTPIIEEYGLFEKEPKQEGENV
ncbi:DNA replication terminus site-binding protein [Vibrio sp. Hal054]|uniref:DNA replication terminus site-binding protein n=1 Tax=Vibrio sp. Hal054 TaxID=3035158 RepID=UPI00301D236D